MPAPHATVDLPSSAFTRRRQVQPEILHESPARLMDRLKAFPLFAHLPPARLSVLASNTQMRVYGAGDVIWRQGESSRWVLFIEDGLAITSRNTSNGVNRTYGLYGPGDSLGLYATWSGGKYPTDALALNHGLKVLLLSASTLVRMARAGPLLLEPLMAGRGRFAAAVIRKIGIVSAGTVSQRVATLMLMLLERYGVSMGDHAARLPIRMTLEQIGAITDARIETVARALSEWKREGWMSNDQDGFNFSALDRLKNLATA